MVLRRSCRYFYSLSQRRHHIAASMKAWQLHKFGQPEDLILSTTRNVPPICNPNDVLVQVHAASINPIDVKMMGGYGSQILQLMRNISRTPESVAEFPIILGRDFSGVVVNVGNAVSNFKPGDEISLKPRSISHKEAAAIPYAALTAWSALCSVGGLDERSCKGLRILVFGGSGGVGTLAIQLLHAWGSRVTAVCSTDAVDMVRSLGAADVLDYKTQDIWRELNFMKGFDFVLDAVGGDTPAHGLNLLKQWRNAKYVTIVPPFLSNTDKYGVGLGVLLSLYQASLDTVYSMKDGRSMRWAFFCPNGKALKQISKLVDEGKIRPVVEQVYPFSECPNSYKRVMAGHLRGKIILEVNAKETTKTPV